MKQGTGVLLLLVFRTSSLQGKRGNPQQLNLNGHNLFKSVLISREKVTHSSFAFPLRADDTGNPIAVSHNLFMKSILPTEYLIILLLPPFPPSSPQGRPGSQRELLQLPSSLPRARHLPGLATGASCSAAARQPPVWRWRLRDLLGGRASPAGRLRVT